MDQRDVQPHVGGLGHHGRQLRLVLHVVPPVREELPGRLDFGSEGSAGAAPEASPLMRLPGPLRELFDRPPTPGVLAVFGHLDAAVDAIKELREGRFPDVTVYSPVPRHELEDALAQPVSPVRAFTLIGGISGCAAGAWITLYMSYDWPVVVGGKPIGSVPPYVVILFEMTILFGALSSLLGIALNILRAGKLRGTIAYDPRCSNDKFGIFVPCAADRAPAVESVLRNAGAEEVRRA